MLRSYIDHITITAPSVAVGVEYVRRALGVAPQAGGEHPRMGTHLNWLITIPKDGSLPLQGVAPTLIEWHTDAHPAKGLEDLGCSLTRLEGFHPEAETVTRILQAIGFRDEFSVTPLPPGDRPYLVAHIQTPTGPRLLRGLDPSLNPDAERQRAG